MYGMFCSEHDENATENRDGMRISYQWQLNFSSENPWQLNIWSEILILFTGSMSQTLPVSSYTTADYISARSFNQQRFYADRAEI